MNQAKPPSNGALAAPPAILPIATAVPGFYPLRLVLQGGDLTVTLTRLDMVLGRHSQADVRLPLSDVSRRHCRFTFVDGRWTVFDLNSLNGVHVNGQRVDQATLDQGDVIRIGSFQFQVETPKESSGVRPRGHGLDPSNPVLHSIAEVIRSQPGHDLPPPKRQAS